MIIYTSSIRYKGIIPTIDITVKSGVKEFAPSWDMVMGVKSGKYTWPQYVEKYYTLMRASYKKSPGPFLEVLHRKEVVLTCYCTDFNTCHRSLLAHILIKIGESFGMEVTYGGEI